MSTRIELRTQVRQLLNLESDTRITEDIVDDYLDRAYIRVVRLMRSMRTSSVILLAVTASSLNYTVWPWAGSEADRIYEISTVYFIPDITTDSYGTRLIYMPVSRLQRMFATTWTKPSATAPLYWTQLNMQSISPVPRISSAYISAHPNLYLGFEGYIIPDVTLWDDAEAPLVTDSVQQCMVLHAANSITLSCAEDESTQWRNTILGQDFTARINKEIEEQNNVAK